ncbi:MAG: lactate racemase domain-containing protein [Parahaliea sp.]
MIGDKISVNIAGGLDVEMPRMVRVRQKFETPQLEDPVAELRQQFRQDWIAERVKPGMRIAVGCGSRGIANVAACARVVIDELKALGAEPFIFPAMGTHGAASAEGQVSVLAKLGISEESMGCPIRSSMEVVELGQIDNGMPVYFDQNAAGADAVVLLCRIKPHTNYRAPIESGICKMLVIGAGKIKGASTTHWHGFDSFGEIIPKAARLVMEKRKFLFGVAMVENAADETALVEIVAGEKVFSREPELLAMAMKWMPKLQFDEIDVLIVDRMGKNITGAGMDPNIIGRNARGTEWPRKPDIKKIAVLGLTDETEGNATGVGGADVITMRLYRDFDPAKTYANVIAPTLLDGAAIPIIMNTDKEAVQLAAKTVLRTKSEDTRIVHIANTLEIIEIDVSETLLPYIKSHPEQFEIIGEPAPLDFDAEGNLALMPTHGVKGDE